MSVLPVEWVLIVYYGPEAHRATYGRKVRSDRYTKDYIQLSRKAGFIDGVRRAFHEFDGQADSIPLTYQWPSGSTAGALVLRSSDRPHLKWETSSGAPQAWRMTNAPSDGTPETIPGDPTHLEFEAAEEERTLVQARGAGQPYLVAIKLRGEPSKLHLRVYLDGPGAEFKWADLQLTPPSIRELARQTSQHSALAWSEFPSSGTAPTVPVKGALERLESTADAHGVLEELDMNTQRLLASFLQTPGHGLFFDPARNHDAWSESVELGERMKKLRHSYIAVLDLLLDVQVGSDAAAEMLDVSATEVAAFKDQVERGDFEVPDSLATVKTRGSAQRAFAETVKENYSGRCAITGMSTRAFLIAAHIVPWSEDHTIRLDPTNGICLSVLMDQAFELGYLQIEDDLTLRVDLERIGPDGALRDALARYDGKKLTPPRKGVPRAEYLKRRRELTRTRGSRNS